MTDDRPSGRDGFSEKYWEENYADAKSMDGIINAKEHALYTKYFFGLDFIDISSIIDFGFGLGHLFEAFLDVYKPYRACGVEPSKSVFEKVSSRKLTTIESTKLTLQNTDILSWARSQKEKSPWFDLGICTSVFQYLTEKELDEVIPVMAQKVKYLYLTVPTNVELKKQREELDFHDTWAYGRSYSWYWKKLRPHFTCVGSRILESKVHFDKDSTLFTECLYRF